MNQNSKDTAGRIIVVDDEPSQRVMMEHAVKSMGYDVEVASTPQEVLQRIRTGNFDVLLTDMQMPWMDGIRLTEQVKQTDPTVSCVLITAHGTIETAVEAMKKGAEDYVLKPIEFDAMKITLDRIFKNRTLIRENKRLINENQVLKRDLGIRYHLPSTLGRSAHATKLHDEIKKYMKNRDPLLIIGETGVGKEDIARMIHYNGPWAENSFLAFDCNMVPADLHEPHLFGEEENTLGGILIPGRPGLVEKAHLGTLLIENSHMLNPKCYPGLYHASVDGKTQRINGRRFHPVQIRLIATTSVTDLKKNMKEEIGTNLISTLIDHTIIVPCLRERKEDIGILIAATAKRFGATVGKPIEKIDPAIVQMLSEYTFPGNMNELESMIEVAILNCQDGNLKMENFPPLGGVKHG